MSRSSGAESGFSAGRWRARWIWSHDPGVGLVGPVGAFSGGREPSWAMLRREFDLASVPTQALARLTADSRYVLSVNGTESARGPVSRDYPAGTHRTILQEALADV